MECDVSGVVSLFCSVGLETACLASEDDAEVLEEFCLVVAADGGLAGLTACLAGLDVCFVALGELCVAVGDGVSVELADGFIEVALHDANEVAHGVGAGRRAVREGEVLAGGSAGRCE